MNIESGIKLNQNITKNKKKLVLMAAGAFFLFVISLYSAGAGSNSVIAQNQVADSNQTGLNQTTQRNSLFSEGTDFTGKDGINGTEIFYKIMLSIVFVLVLGAAAVFMTKKYLPKIAKLQGKEIRVVETVHLGPRKSVHLLEIGKRRFLIGSTNENIRKLADLTDFSSSLTMQEEELD